MFGRDDTIRPGWLTVGPTVTISNFDTQKFCTYFEKTPGMTTGCSDRIELLRPKSPVPMDKRQRQEGPAPGVGQTVERPLSMDRRDSGSHRSHRGGHGGGMRPNRR